MRNAGKKNKPGPLYKLDSARISQVQSE